eukprot:COSAG06_NODE_329_length_17412_cov_9.404015_17_plen_317_part_00
MSGSQDTSAPHADASSPMGAVAVIDCLAPIAADGDDDEYSNPVAAAPPTLAKNQSETTYGRQREAAAEDGAGHNKRSRPNEGSRTAESRRPADESSESAAAGSDVGSAAHGDDGGRVKSSRTHRRKYSRSRTDLVVRHVPCNTSMQQIIDYFSQYCDPRKKEEIAKVKTHVSRPSGELKALIRFSRPGPKDKVRAAFNKMSQQAARPASSTTPPPEEAEDLQKTVSTTTRTAKPTKTDPPSPQPGDRSKSVVEDVPRFPAAAGKAEGSNYRTPPLMLTNGRGGNTGLRIERTRSADQKSEASEAMCALAEMSQMCV